MYGVEYYCIECSHLFRHLFRKVCIALNGGFSYFLGILDRFPANKWGMQLIQDITFSASLNKNLFVTNEL